MIGPLEALALGATQGLTEYLPVSSSGHLVIAQSLFGLKEPALFFDITLHVGTLLAILWFYRSDIIKIFSDIASGARELWKGAEWGDVCARAPGLRFAFLIIAGTIPTGIIGVAFEDAFEQMFGSPRRAGAMLIVTGVILFLTRYAKASGRGIEKTRWWEAFIIGVAQGIAITPGISRSGATISAAMLLGVEKETAARFSFLLSVPSIAGAMILKAGDGDGGVPFSSLALGFSSSVVVGYLCLALLVALVKRGRFSWFSYYCVAAGALALAFAG